METRITPLIEQANQMLKTSIEDNRQMKEMIRRFDEVLSDKVSKVSLDQYSKDAKALYVMKENY
jgi:hypothetical protein